LKILTSILSICRQKDELQNRMGSHLFAAGAVLAVLFFFQAMPEKAFGQLLPLPTSIPILSPQQNLNTDSKINASLSTQLLNLLAQGSVGLGGTAANEMVVAIVAPLTYNTNPGLSSGSSTPAWEFDPQVEMLHSSNLGGRMVLTENLAADSAIYPDNSNYNMNTLSGQLQLNFTDEGVHFDAAPFIAYKTSYVFPPSSSAHAWVNDFAVGYNFNHIFGIGGKDDDVEDHPQNDPLEIDLNPSISQRLIEVNDESGNSSTSGSTAFELEIPFIYRFNSRLNLIFDLTSYARYYNVYQAPQNEDRVDEAIALPLSISWTMVPAWNLKLLALGGYTQQFSTESDQNITQVNAGIDLMMIF
jgi:hypothetical protein